MVLEGIVARQRRSLEESGVRAARRALEARAASAPPPRDFRAAILAGPTPAVIAECKQASPVKGPLTTRYDVPTRCAAYVAGGASAISVLTNADFMGSLDDLAAARRAVDLPLLRKDFVIDEVQLLEARANGADGVLLIVRITDRARLRELAAAARDLGLQTLVEVYSADEVDAALAAEPDLLGVNHRDLGTFEVDPTLLARVVSRLPAQTIMVAESGMSTREDVVAAAASGARAVLVGESLMRAADPAAKLRELLGS